MGCNTSEMVKNMCDVFLHEMCILNAIATVQVVENAVRAVTHLRSLGCQDIEFSPEDAGRSEPRFLYRVLSEVRLVRPPE